MIDVTLDSPCLSFLLSCLCGDTDAKLSESDVFNEACSMRLAAQLRSSRNRGRRELDLLTSCTQFTRHELKVLYWGWKCSCLSGCLTETAFKGQFLRKRDASDFQMLTSPSEIYAQFFPQAGLSQVRCSISLLTIPQHRRLQSVRASRVPSHVLAQVAGRLLQ